ncbi:MAG: BrnT family toxin [Clostridiales Family XIII bacterium]|jgi:uncharacterized DUF497 family protein|nr:BrnT family toxin [Clostridiales Family XIII bacterium]
MKTLDIYRHNTYNVIIRGIRYIWDENKNKTNLIKHGVVFEEAATIFSDCLYVEMHDPVHSNAEERFLAIGLSKDVRLLAVCYCASESEEMIRIISARRATLQEAVTYTEENNARRI